MKPSYAELEQRFQEETERAERAERLLDRIQEVASDYSVRSSMQVAVINGILNGPEQPTWPEGVWDE